MSRTTISRLQVIISGTVSKVSLCDVKPFAGQDGFVELCIPLVNQRPTLLEAQRRVDGLHAENVETNLRERWSED